MQATRKTKILMSIDNFILRLLPKQLFARVSSVPSVGRLARRATWILIGTLARCALLAVFQLESKVI
jgi:hypothetical protein